MTEGLRERKKEAQRRAIAGAAMQLFGERGFDAVTVAEVAAKAETSVQTVFNYYPAKEDLMLWGRRRHEEELLRAVRERAPGVPVLDAVEARVRQAAFEMAAVPMEFRERFGRIVRSTPTLLARFRSLGAETELELARLLAADTGVPETDPKPRVVAAVLMSLAQLAYAEPGAKDGQYPRIEAGFALLRNGIAGYATRTE
jgi:AcrR family transcriptional regulator